MKTLRIACSALPTSIDREQPTGLFQVENVDAHLQLYEPLTGYAGASPGAAGRAKSLELKPLAAERWERLEGGARYRFWLRPGIYSAFGNELTAKDVCWTWERSLALGTVGAWIGSNAGITSAEQVQAVDRYTVEFLLPHPTTILPHLLSVIVPTVFDAREARSHATVDDPWALAWLREFGAGFSAYVVEKPSRSGRFRLRKNEHYWHHPLVYDAVEFVALSDPDERWRELARGEFDAAIDLIGDDGAEGVNVHHVPLTLQTKLGLNCTRPPFQYIEVRQAVAQAIPYDRIITEAYRGHAKRMHSCIADTIIGYSPVKPRWDYCPEKARKLLRPLLPLPSVQLAYCDFLAFPTIAEIVREALADVDLEVELLPLSCVEHGIRKSTRDLDMFLDQDGPITIDGRYSLGHDFNPPLGGVFDFTGYHNAQIDRLLRASLIEMDDAQMQALLAEVQRIALREVPWVPLAQHMFSFGLRSSIRGYRWYPLPRLRVRDLGVSPYVEPSRRRRSPVATANVREEESS